MLNVHIEIPSGAQSKGYDREKDDAATKIFDAVVAQIRRWQDYTADVVLTDIGIEIRREHIDASL